MKKVKMILSAIAVFAIVGGALAFKTNSSVYGGALLCNTPQQGSTTCADQITKYASDQTNGSTMVCNSGVVGDLNCTNNVKVVSNP